ncbi:MAG TPA: hypothetical protein VFA61_04375 [Candidatus Udaeobacter sp.]|nr:hypothetical protein [Candidatus Udaeobacter sp.]
MAAFEYLSVLISIILALGMTRVLGGVGEMPQARSHRRIYRVHAIWIINLFLYLVIAWWIFYRWRYQEPWRFLLFVFVLISPTLLYLASLLLFPREGDIDSAIDYKTHYYANHRAFFILFALFTPVDIADSLLKGVPHFLTLGPIYFISNALYFVGLTTAAITRNERYHEFYAIFFLVQTIIISFLIFQTLV